MGLLALLHVCNSSPGALNAAVCALQMLVALAVAMTLNRTLVMPRFVCFCDRYW